MKREDAIYMLAAAGTLERVPLQTYATEDLLQKLIEDYPALLAAEQIDPDDPIAGRPTISCSIISVVPRLLK
jgi:hypothetical protein